MAYTAPTVRTTGELITASIWNVDLVADIAYLKNAPTFDGNVTVTGTIAVNTLGTHAFTGAGVGANRIQVLNTSSGAANLASYRLTAGTSDFFINTFSQGYTPAGADMASGTTLEVTSSGGLSINASAGSAVVRIYGAGTLSGTFASTGLTLPGLLAANGFGVHTFAGAGTGANRVTVSNSTSGTTMISSFRSNCGTSDFYVNTFSQGYTSAGADFANGSSVEVNTSGGLSINASAGSATVRIYGSNTLSATFAAAGVTIPGTLGVTGVVTGGTYNGQTISSTASFTGTVGVTGDFAINTNKFTVAASSGNTVVAGTLGVTGAATVTGQILAKTGSAASPSYGFSADPTTGIFTSSNAIGFACSGVQVANAISRSPAAGGEIGAVGGAWGTGNVGGSRVVAGRNTSGNGAAGCLGLFRRTNNQRFLWVDDSGSDILRIHTAAPTEDNSTVADTAGTVVGTQTSTRASKDITGSFTENAKALRTILKTPLWKFRYKSGAYNNQKFVGITTDDSPIFGMDKGRSFNPVTTAAYLMAAVKELAKKLDQSSAEIATLRARLA